MTITIRSRCDTRGKRFWIETAVEYTFANASSDSSTVSAPSASTDARPPAATAAGSAAGSDRSRESRRSAPIGKSQSVGTRYPSPTPQKALRRLREKRV